MNFFAAKNKYFALVAWPYCLSVPLCMFVHVFLWIGVLNWIYDAPLSETAPFPQVMSTVCTGLDPVSSHSPSAPLILSKSHYNPTNPSASLHDCLLLAAQPSTLGLGTGLEAPFSLPLPSLRKRILSCHCGFFPVTAAKCIRVPAAGAAGASFREVGGNSVTGRTGRDNFFTLALGGLF